MDTGVLPLLGAEPGLGSRQRLRSACAGLVKRSAYGLDVLVSELRTSDLCCKFSVKNHVHEASHRKPLFGQWMEGGGGPHLRTGVRAVRSEIAGARGGNHKGTEIGWRWRRARERSPRRDTEIGGRRWREPQKGHQRDTESGVQEAKATEDSRKGSCNEVSVDEANDRPSRKALASAGSRFTNSKGSWMGRRPA